MHRIVSAPRGHGLVGTRGIKILYAVVVLGALLVSWDALYAQERLTHRLGEFEYQDSANGILICAPHGTYDKNTDEIAIEAARSLGAGYIVARRFTVYGTRLNVNRPSEGAGRLYSAQESRTKRSREVFEIYSDLVRKASGGRPLRLYVEIHGNSSPLSAYRIELASTGVSRDEALRLKEVFPAMIHDVSEGTRKYPHLKLLVEPVDRITYVAGGVKSFGVMADELVPRALHFELPQSARQSQTCAATAALIAAIAKQIVDQDGAHVPQNDQRERPRFRRAQ